MKRFDSKPVNRLNTVEIPDHVCVQNITAEVRAGVQSRVIRHSLYLLLYTVPCGVQKLLCTDGPPVWPLIHPGQNELNK